MENKYKYYAITTTFIGAIFGAGFVSGQELLQFYASYGLYCIFGLLLMFILYVTLAYMSMSLAYDKKVTSYEEVIVGDNEKAKSICNITINVILFFVLIIMFAGAGALLNNFFGVSKFFGSIGLALVVMLICLNGANGIVKVFSFIVPTMVVLAIISSILGIIYGNEPLNFNTVEFVKQPTPFWITSALLAVSYIFIVQIPILSPLGIEAKNKKHILLGSFFGALIISIVAALICFAMLKNINLIVGVDMPMLIISNNISSILGIVYLVVLAIGIFSSSLAMMFALVNRLEQSTIKINNKVSIIFICMFALFLSLIGFSNLISIVYPIVGYIGFIANGGVIVQFIKNKRLKKTETINN
ncbi:putative membrane protein YkvI [Bacilli bacterium PM5-9]|nr:putative membrane protein YkvI [Bacilli bacterium PM5-9]